MIKVKYSVLDLVIRCDNDSAKDSISRSLLGARHIESLGFNRLWFAEHHNSLHSVSSATSVIICYIAKSTKKIRIGSGGIMLNNHSPLVIAEQFGTLESMYPNRIDLGVGRASGTDEETSKALRRNDKFSKLNYENDILALQNYFCTNDNLVKANPGHGLNVPLWILGSSVESARMAAELGLPYAFASHLMPDNLIEASKIYKSNFKKSQQCSTPYLMICVNIIASKNVAEAQYLSSSYFNMLAGKIANRFVPFSAPTDVPIYEGIVTVEESVAVARESVIIGNKYIIAARLKKIISEVEADEIMTTNYIYNENEFLKGFTEISEAFKILNK